MPKMYGGIHPQHPWPPKEKLLKKSGWYIDISPTHVYLPMRQNVGAPCTSSVKVGDGVNLGQRVGESDAKVSALVHASVSGTVVDIGEYPTLNGRVETVVIRNDGRNTRQPGLKPYGDIASLSKEEIVEAVHEGGIVGMGGATFPTHIKLQPETPIDTVLVNGCECEPMQAADDALMQQNPAAILEGCRAAMKAVGAEKAIVGIEANKPAAIDVMQGNVSHYPEITVAVVPTMYPAGGEKQLIQVLTGREVPAGSLPADVGILVLNAATCAAIASTLRSGMPLTRRIITVTGDVNRPCNIRFPIGTRAADLIDAAGGFAGTPSKVIAGGPMMGKALETLEVPLTKGSNGLIVKAEKHDTAYTESPCIRCNKCAKACPMRLMPMFLDKYARKGNITLCERFLAQSCINCGCCTYVCPARRKLAETIYASRGEILAKQKEGNR